MYSGLAGEQTEQLFDCTTVCGARAVELLGPGQDLQTGLVLRHQFAQELAVQAVKIVDRIEDAESGSNAEKQPDLTEARLEVDDDRLRACRGGQARHRS